jgi:hypothetical protein
MIRQNWHCSVLGWPRHESDSNLKKMHMMFKRSRVKHRYLWKHVFLDALYAHDAREPL